MRSLQSVVQFPNLFFKRSKTRSELLSTQISGPEEIKRPCNASDSGLIYDDQYMEEE